MYPAIRYRRRGAALSNGLLIALTVLGVLLMHSVTPTTTINTSTSTGAHSSMASTSPVDNSIVVAFGEHDCPTAHQMMHPCAGATVSWPSLTAPATNVEIDLSPTSVNRIGGRTEFTLERAPPWTLWELDKSVTLRV